MSDIVVIDDDEFTCRTLGRMLELLGHHVRIAANGRAGLSLVRAAMPDVVITDLVMPDKDGLEVIMELRRAFPALRVVAMTGCARFSAETLLQMAGRLGAQALLPKPFTPEQLQHSLDAVLLCSATPNHAFSRAPAYSAR